MLNSESGYYSKPSIDTSLSKLRPLLHRRTLQVIIFLEMKSPSTHGIYLIITSRTCDRLARFRLSYLMSFLLSCPSFLPSLLPTTHLTLRYFEIIV